MTSSVFFDQLSQQFDKQLPFVAFKKPNQETVKAILQDSNQLHFTQNFKESGFVFSPFKNEDNTVLFPLNKSQTISCLYDNTSVDAKNQLSSTISISAKAKHIQIVEKAISEIENGSFKKVVLSRVESEAFPEANTILLFQKLLSTYKTAMVYCWYHPKVGLWLGATPETLLKVEGNRFLTMSLAGTQQYKNTVDVQWQSKEQEEQQLVTDFIVGSLETSVSSINLGKTETIKAGNLLHLQTKISGLLKPENGLQSVISKLHPTPAVCGLPKEKAKQFILKNEGYNREYYTGFLGEINIKQSKTRNTNRRNVENNAYGSVKTISHLFVNLRCLQIKDNQALIYVGGGITKDSVPENEWEETVAKSKTVKNLL